MTVSALDGVSVSQLTDAQWLTLRETSLGSSECAAALGLSPWETPIDVWQRKCKLAPPIAENEAMRWGKLLEPVIQAEYERRESVLLATQLFVRHPDLPYLTATLDGIRPDGRIVEFKTAGAFAKDWGNEDTDEVPMHYLVQCHHQMIVAGADEADLAVLIGGQRFRVYRINRDELLAERIVAGAQEFWRHVGIRTPPTWGRLDAAALAVLHPTCQGSMEFGVSGSAALQTYRENDYQIKRMTDENEALKAQILAEMGDAQIGVASDGTTVKRYVQECPARQVSYLAKQHTKHFFKIVKGD